MALSIDSNVLIQAKNHDFPMDVVPGFWVAIDRAMQNGSIFVIQGVYKELVDGNDELAEWMKAREEFAQDHRSCVETQRQYRAVDRLCTARRAFEQPLGSPPLMLDQLGARAPTGLQGSDVVTVAATMSGVVGVVQCTPPGRQGWR
jgi:hypothetical protein